MALAMWKYVMYSKSLEELLPVGAKTKSCQLQDGLPTIWILLDPDQRKLELRTFFYVETGELIEMGPKKIKFIDTVQSRDGSSVLHVFEKIG